MQHRSDFSRIYVIFRKITWVHQLLQFLSHSLFYCHLHFDNLACLSSRSLVVPSYCLLQIRERTGSLSNLILINLMAYLWDFFFYLLWPFADSFLGHSLNACFISWQQCGRRGASTKQPMGLLLDLFRLQNLICYRLSHRNEMRFFLYMHVFFCHFRKKV